MKVLISADMEGATGVTWPVDVEPGTEQWQRCGAMFTSDVNGRHEDVTMVEGVQHGDVDAVAFVGYPTLISNAVEQDDG